MNASEDVIGERIWLVHACVALEPGGEEGVEFGFGHALRGHAGLPSLMSVLRASASRAFRIAAVAR